MSSLLLPKPAAQEKAKLRIRFLSGAADGRSRPVAAWLFVVAALVFAMIVVGGATRLTDSGLSITEWRPITGAVPPLTHAGWLAEFEKYQRIPEYRYVNAGMSLGDFQSIYWWEWGHRFLGRLIGLAFFLPFAAFLLTGRMPARLVGRSWLLLALGGLQGAVGWWMVSSGLSERVDVAPERLAAHLGLALGLFSLLIWTGLEAWSGPAAETPARRWFGPAVVLLTLVFGQSLLGAFVAGNDAGRVFTDWPLMDGRLIPAEYGAESLWRTLAHDLAAVQLHHRLGAYLLFALVWGLAFAAWWRAPRPVRIGASALAVLVTLQFALGVATLMNAVPVGLGVLHQAGAALVLAAATVLTWSARRT